MRLFIVDGGIRKVESLSSLGLGIPDGAIGFEDRGDVGARKTPGEQLLGVIDGVASRGDGSSVAPRASTEAVAVSFSLFLAEHCASVGPASAKMWLLNMRLEGSGL